MKIYTNDIESLIETKIKPNLKKIYQMRIEGLADTHIAKFLGIGVVKFRKVLEECPGLKEVYDDATLLLCRDLRHVVMERALGTDGKTGKDGEQLGPDPGLALKLLDRLDPQFQRNQTVNVNVIKIEDVIRGIKEKNIEYVDVIDEVVEKNKELGYEESEDEEWLN